MRKRTINCFFDTLFWFIVSILPLVAFVILLFFNGAGGVDLSTVINNIGFGLNDSNAVYVAISSIFGVGGVLPLFANTDIILYLSYFVIVTILHVFVDVLLIPSVTCVFNFSLSSSDNLEILTSSLSIKLLMWAASIKSVPVALLL